MMLVTAAVAGSVVLASPDGATRIEVASDGSTLSVSRKGEQILAPSPLGLELSDAPNFAKLKLAGVKRDTQRRTIPLTATKARSALDHYNSALINFREAGNSRRTLTIEARAYNDGIAFRYLLPHGAPVAVKDERTAFRFGYDPTCLFTEHATSHEKHWNSLKLSQLDPAKAYDVLAVCASKSGRTHFAIAQSDLAGYAGATLKPADGGLKLSMIPRIDRKDVAVLSPGGLKSAWRVVMMGNRAGDLIESNLIGNLAPQADGDFSWVKPGLVAWDWWSGATTAEKPSMELYKRFIDFAAASGFPYFLIDAGWAYKTGPCCNALPETDITRPEPGLDMPALAKYASDKGVGLLLWAHWKHVEPRMAEVLDTYRRWGIKGVKVDFMERDDQQMVDFYVRLARETAKRQLLLDMHGAFLPMGLSRTYPNYITQEGVLGLEYNKWTDLITPAHNVKLAYTRMLPGPMDYTPGGFRNGTPATFKASDISPMTQHTRGHALAQYVVYESPLQMVSDNPSAYENAAGFEFIKAVPTAWDETRFIGGTPESHIVLARRKGTRWYIGAMTNEQARTVEIPLTMLGRGTFNATIWRDGAGPNDVERTDRRVTPTDRLTIAMSTAGGAAIVLEPVGSQGERGR
ncbi:MAG TPA: glycoside hydrolase family 97 protein [Sphingomicrobium sp.]|nr:glycoside hydrolase family 97 protein [Sphingomicrobium sp.]